MELTRIHGTRGRAASPDGSSMSPRGVWTLISASVRFPTWASRAPETESRVPGRRGMDAIQPSDGKGFQHDVDRLCCRLRGRGCGLRPQAVPRLQRLPGEIRSCTRRLAGGTALSRRRQDDGDSVEWARRVTPCTRSSLGSCGVANRPLMFCINVLVEEGVAQWWMNEVGGWAGS